MWEAYSNKHTGFCVGFDTEIMFKYLGGGGIVNYMDELPIIYPFPKTSLEERHVLQIFSKLKQWDHEREYRTFEFSPSPLNESQRKKILPPEVFKEIIVGNKMPLDLKDELVRLIPKELAHIKILKEKEI
jgi:hypothetical protein